MNPVKRFVYRYIYGVMLLHYWGERAWPWHVRAVWSLTDFSEKRFEEMRREGRQ